MMNNQEKLYIDIDEEITTVIDRLRRTLANIVYVVIPQRALLLQSIVNLKLLEREAKKQGKRIIIMTKDEEGIVFASRAGIEVQPFIGSEDNFEQSTNDNYFSENNFSDQYFSPNQNQEQSFNENFDNNYLKQNNQSNFSQNENNNYYYSQQSQNNLNIQRPKENNFSSNYYSQIRNEKNRSNYPQKNSATAKPINLRNENNSNKNYVRNNNFSNVKNFENLNRTNQQNYQNNFKSGLNIRNENNFQNNYQQKNTHRNIINDSNNRNSFVNQASLDDERKVVIDDNFYQFNQGEENRVNNSSQNQAQSYAQVFAQDVNSNQNSFYKNNSQVNLSQDNINKNDYFSDNRTRDFSEAANFDVSYSSRRKLENNDQNKSKRFFGKNKSDLNKNGLHKREIDRKNHVKSGSGFFLKSLIFLGVAVLILLGLFLIFPKTELNIKLKEVNISEKFSFTAKVDQEKTDSERMLIPARKIEKEIVYTRSFPSTGKADVTAQKAQGMVTLNNETDEDIKMIKTTRFLSENGILFRLATDVVVPKAKTEGTTKINGTVKALLVADEAGEKGNAKSSTFFVATYKENNSDLYKKVYAKSDSEMLGGGTGGKGLTVVTDEDIKKAKENMESSLNSYIKKELGELLRDDEKILNDNQIKFNITSSNSKVVTNTAVDKFDYEIIAEVTSMVFFQKDVDELANSIIKKKNSDADLSKLEINYNSVKLELDSGTLKSESVANVKYEPNFDVNQFQQDIAGKDYEEVENLIKENYKQIEGTIEPVASPSFLSGRISKIIRMTKVNVE